MTETEFETKLTQVSDAKLLKMLEVSRREGPPVALKMILAESKSRGLEGIDSDKGEGLSGNTVDSTGIDPEVEAAMVKAASQAIGYGGPSASVENPELNEGPSLPPELQMEDADLKAEENPTEQSSESANWLDEESQKSKGPKIVKVLIILGGLAALIFMAYKFIYRG